MLLKWSQFRSIRIYQKWKTHFNPRDYYYLVSLKVNLYEIECFVIMLMRWLCFRIIKALFWKCQNKGFIATWAKTHQYLFGWCRVNTVFIEYTHPKWFAHILCENLHIYRRYGNPTDIWHTESHMEMVKVAFSFSPLPKTHNKPEQQHIELNIWLKTVNAVFMQQIINKWKQ